MPNLSYVIRVACLLSALCSVTRAAPDLSLLTVGRHVQIRMVGFGPLCTATVHSISTEIVLRVESPSAQCGQRGSLIHLQISRIFEAIPERRLSDADQAKRMGILLAAAAALGSLPLAGSDPEDKIGIPYLAIAGGYIGWVVARHAILGSIDYVLIVVCADSHTCFTAAEANASPR